MSVGNVLDFEMECDDDGEGIVLGLKSLEAELKADALSLTSASDELRKKI